VTYRVLLLAEFASIGDARQLFETARSTAQNASVAGIGTAGESFSYSRVLDEDNAVITRTGGGPASWYIDIFGILRDGLPGSPDGPPAWIQPTGAQDAYPLLDVFGNPARVTFNGQVWQNTTAANTFQPGVFGWDAV
jgi:hypothetical protein